MSKHHDLMVDMAAVLTAKGYRLVRDNEGGGAMVLENDERTRIVFGLSVYEGQEPWQPVPAFIRPDPPEGLLVPAVEAGGGKQSVGWVIEDDEGNFWDGTKYQEMLSDGAEVYTDAEKAQRESGEKVMPTNGRWVPLYAHEVDGCLTTEPCEGVSTCQDCLDVRESVGEDTTNAETVDPIPLVEHVVAATYLDGQDEPPPSKKPAAE